MAAGDAPNGASSTAHQSTTFTPPPLKGSYFADWFDHHLEKSHDHPFCLLVGRPDEENTTITWGEAMRATMRLAAKLREEVKATDEQRKEGIKIAILTNTDSLTYFTMIMAVIRAGFTVFPLSTRNSVPALEHLIKKTNSLYLWGSIPKPGAPSSALQETTAEVLELVPDVNLIEVPKYTDLYPRFKSSPVKPYDAQEDALHTPKLPRVRDLPEYANVTAHSPLVIIHSSGSTSFPKPIPMSHRFWASVSETLGFGDFVPAGTRWGVMGLPPFHGMGVFLTMGAPAALGIVPALFAPSYATGVPSPEKVLDACKRAQVDYVIAVPSHLVDWSEDPEAIKFLASLKGVFFGGGPLPVESGDRIAKAGVNLRTAYGTTEVGLIFRLGVEKGNPEDWNYGELFPSMKYKLEPEGNNLYRIIVIDCDEKPIAVSNSSDPDVMAFDTNDLLEQHPTRKNLYRVIGRADDQIMMSNGEKTNPGPMESIINGNPNVKACLMFGRARTQVGIVIQPADHIKIKNEDDLAKFRNLIWPDIEKANAFAPQHSRIFKEFILVIDPEKKPFVMTPKGTIARNATLQQYSEEIDALYAAAEQPTKAEWAEPPTTWDEDAIHAFIVRVVNGVMRGEDHRHSPIDDSRDLFEQGCDSLQATYIRAAIMNALRQAPKPEGKSDVAATSVPQNLVFSYPTVKRLVSYMRKAVAALAGHEVHHEDDTADVVEDMEAMVEKYSKDFPEHKPGKRNASGEVVLLTGSTGTLGTYLLEQLLLDDRVERVYALNRGSTKHDLLARQRQAFDDRGVDVKLIDSPKLRLVEAEVASENLGLSAELYEEICGSLSTIIHNAWRLDFNLSLGAFEPNVRSSRELVNLALKAHGPTPAQLVFTSSVGTVMKWSKPRPVPEEPLKDPIIASATGYSASKWVAEHIMLNAAQLRGLRTTIWRVGQLAGSSQNGAWNTTDWLPMIVKSGERLKVLPSVQGYISWLPTDKAAQSIIDVVHSDAASPAGSTFYLHLVHPHPVKWDTVLSPMASSLGCKLVPFADWLHALEKAGEDPSEVERNPAIKLLEFYKGVGAADAARAQAKEGQYAPKEAMGIADLETKKAEGKSVTLRELKPLGEEDAHRWMEYWRKKGLFA